MEFKAEVQINYAELAAQIVKKLFQEKKPLQKCAEELTKLFERVALDAKQKERERCASIAFNHRESCTMHGDCIADSILEPEELNEF